MDTDEKQAEAIMQMQAEIEKAIKARVDDIEKSDVSPKEIAAHGEEFIFSGTPPEDPKKAKRHILQVITWRNIPVLRVNGNYQEFTIEKLNTNFQWNAGGQSPR